MITKEQIIEKLASKIDSLIVIYTMKILDDQEFIDRHGYDCCIYTTLEKNRDTLRTLQELQDIVNKYYEIPWD